MRAKTERAAKALAEAQAQLAIVERLTGWPTSYLVNQELSIWEGRLACELGEHDAQTNANAHWCKRCGIPLRADGAPGETPQGQP